MIFVFGIKLSVTFLILLKLFQSFKLVQSFVVGAKILKTRPIRSSLEID